MISIITKASLLQNNKDNIQMYSCQRGKCESECDSFSCPFNVGKVNSSFHTPKALSVAKSNLYVEMIRSLNL